MLNKNNVCSSWGVHTVGITLQFEEYKGKITTKVKGNCRGFGVLEAAKDYITDSNNKSNCDFKVIEEGFDCILKNKKGELMGFSDTLDNLDRYIVKLEIIEFEEG